MKGSYQKWGDVFNSYLDQGHDHGSAAYMADQWESRKMANLKTTNPLDKVIPSCYKQPIAQISWLDRDSLDPNNYNPNKIAPPELELLKTSILEDGWTQPIVTLPEQDGRYQIIDGYHRWLISGDDAVYRLTNGMVPTVQVKLDPVHQQMSTIRHNRARGTHGVLKIADIVRSILEAGITERELMERLGMEREEVVRLNNRAGMPEQIGKGEFGKAWIPKKNAPTP